MSDWQTCAVRDSFVKSKVGRQNQIPAKDIADVGQYPVVDQGQDFIAGYCDDVSKLITLNLPFIIFGDHTRCFKYVDFPFVLGADGTKILMPNKEFYYPKFYYYALLALEIPSRGYNRHFKSLKEQSLPLPRLSEQKKIAHILSTVQRAIEAQERIIQTTTELFKSMLHQLMTAQISVSNGDRIKGVSGRGRGMSDWQTCTVPDSFVKNKVGRQNQILAKDIAKAGIFPVVDQGQDFVSGYCDDARKVIDFDLPFIIFGDHTRCFKYINFPFVLGADGTKVLLPNKEIYDPKFYYFALLALELPSRGYNRHFKSLKEHSLPLPPLPEQKKIAHTLSAIQRKVDNAQSKKSKLQDIFRTLLHELMTAKMRVHDLKLPTGEHST